MFKQNKKSTSVKVGILILVIIIVLVVLSISLNYFKRLNGNRVSENIQKHWGKKNSQNKYVTNFVKEGKTLEEGMEEMGEEEYLLIGKFNSSIYEEDGMNVAKVNIRDNDLLLIFKPSKWPILTMFTNTGEILPSKRILKGKKKAELNKYIEEGTPFVARIQFPNEKLSEWDQFTTSEKEYFNEIKNEMPNQVIGLVKNLILHE